MSNAEEWMLIEAIWGEAEFNIHSSALDIRTVH